MAPRLLLVNSIGLSGSEILTAELARHPAIAMLPGQNFIGLKNCLYRQHDYSGLRAAELFEVLATEYFMTSGRAWSGLTKDMSGPQRAEYDRDSHKARFVAGSTPSPSLLDHARVFAETYSGRSAVYLGFFGQNLLLSHGRELGSRSDTRILGCANRVELWLAMISQRMTWDCAAAAKFWLVNHLLLARFAAGSAAYREIDLEALVDAREASLREIWDFLGLESGGLAQHPPAGFLRFNPAIFAKVRADAEVLQVIYGALASVRMARELPRWAPDFFARADNVALLERYRDYWNSTSHTNFDWIGPLEEEICERARELTGMRDERSTALDFYHRYNRLSSLTHDAPQTVEPQMLGCLEAEIPVPLLPFFLKICIEHLGNLARIAERQAHSYRSLRQSRLYAALAAAAGRQAIERLGLGARMAALEEQIDRTEAKVGRAGARRAAEP